MSEQHIPDAYTPSKADFQDRVILVTGAGDGIGKEVTKALAMLGATVIMLGRTTRKLEALYDEIMEAGGTEPVIQPFNLEGAAPKDYEQLIEAIRDNLGRLDGVFNNAGQLGALAPIELHDLELWYKILQVNLNAPLMLTRAALPLLRAAEDASILFTADKVGRQGKAYWGAYGVAKAGLENLSTVLADEHETEGTVRSNTCYPGPVRTRLRRQAYPGEDASTLKGPEEVITPFLYLLGAASKGISGGQFSV